MMAKKYMLLAVLTAIFALTVFATDNKVAADTSAASKITIHLIDGHESSAPQSDEKQLNNLSGKHLPKTNESGGKWGLTTAGGMLLVGICQQYMRRKQHED